MNLSVRFESKDCGFKTQNILCKIYTCKFNMYKNWEIVVWNEPLSTVGMKYFSTFDTVLFTETFDFARFVRECQI